ncbi:tetratricopeptide repeat protein [Zymomonas mobilis]|uniref:Uncharacterized protein n=1 Tax=Zymomonas mobilis subsp. pomaceae (strain ATCC 29192 / DSM 22645 / JCM 10191 / CCUG 17912 / NBRC 13757 / NCIMB 11200 / NRRL B-4491 / Barker I) TaxID=579138 RepID=F8EVF5_ZYMMT|nr:hypothetical protein [Zymomonas mobilis]AEI37362.1 hypothetical protein Zymop_0459 [Zymomonas mobilis subsp. pomaceae ATCC 29192]MDX5948730.1 sporulation protein [Zymomonas mobilis subsp. pomaceae]GEB88535.1 hypothetical protein ZMO02_01720 [Zymomonas mobilis subsp. pomaceae]
MKIFFRVTALAAVIISGVTAASADIVSDRMAAVVLSEQAYRQQPDNSEIQFKLGRAYLMAGRYLSAWQCFNKLVIREPNNDKARLYMALAAIGSNNRAAAQSILAPITKIPPVDLGLALALAGNPAAAIAQLEPLSTTPAATPKLRQNLAFAYAMAGRWNEASQMAGRDLPQEQVSARLTRWSNIIQEKDGAAQLQAFIGVPRAKDYGFLSPPIRQEDKNTNLNRPITVASTTEDSKKNAPVPSSNLNKRPPLEIATLTRSEPASQSASKPGISETQVIVSTQPSPVVASKNAPLLSVETLDKKPEAAKETTVASVTPSQETRTTPSTITEINLPSSEDMPKATASGNSPELASQTEEKVKEIEPVSKKNMAQRPIEKQNKKTLNLPIQEILAQNKKIPSQPDSLSDDRDTSKSPVKTLTKTASVKESIIDKESRKDQSSALKTQGIISGSNCPLSSGTASHDSCHIISHPAIQLATHKLPIVPAVSNQMQKMFTAMQGKVPAVSKYKFIPYSDENSPVYRLLLTGFANEQEAKTICNALMQKETPCLLSSYKEAVYTPKNGNKKKEK